MRFLNTLVIVAFVLPLVACAPADVLNSLVPNDGYEVTRGVPYGDHPRHRLDVYRPAPAVASAPVVVFLYGGSWKKGDRDLYQFIGEAFASRGYVVVVPDYRIYPDVRFPAFVEDAGRALRWVRDHIDAAGGDPERVVLIGHSAGAHIATLLATDGRYLAAVGVPSSSIRGVVGLAGPYALDPFRYRTLRPIFDGVDRPEHVNPITFVSGREPPMLLLQGSIDSLVGRDNARIMAERIRAAGGRVQVIEYGGTGHIGLVLAYASLFRDDEGAYVDTLAFLEEVTGGAGPSVGNGQHPGTTDPAGL